MKRMDWYQYGRIDNTNHKTVNYNYYSLLLFLPVIDPNEINAIPSEIPPSLLST